LVRQLQAVLVTVRIQLQNMRAALTNEVNDPGTEFADGFGVRHRTADQPGPEPLEILRLSPALVAAPSFEFMLRERTSRLANFRHACYARVRRIDRLDGGAGLGIISEVPAGARLSRILEVAQACSLDLDVNAALCLVRQLVPAVAMLHQNAREVAHGAIAPERIVVTSNARVLIVEYVLGAAVEQLGWARDRLWRELRVAVPRTAGAVRLTHRSDVMQLGMVALALVLGRPLTDGDLETLPALIASATESAGYGRRAELSDSLRRWLSRALQLDARSSFESALEAQLALDDVLSGDNGYVAAPIALETFFGRYEEQAAALASLPVDVPAPDDEEEPPAPAADTAPEVIIEPPLAQRPVTVTPEATKPAPIPDIEVPRPDPPAPVEPPRPVVVQAPPEPASPPPPEPASPPPPEPASPPPPPPVIVAPAPIAPVPTPRVPAALEPSSPADAIPPATAVEIAPIAAATASPSRAGGPRRIAPLAVEPPVQQINRSDEEADGEAALRELFATSAPSPASGVSPLWRSVALGLAVLALAQGAFIGWKYRQNVSLMAIATGTLKVDSKPAGAQVKVDGEVKGVTPLSVGLAKGPHVMELASGGEPRVIPITIDPATTLAQYVELASAGATASGRLSVSSNPAGAAILLDGQPRGTTPADLHDVAAGDHELVLDLNGARVRQPVTVTAGATTTIAVPLTPGSAADTAGAPIGGLAVKVPYEMQVFENGRRIGKTTRKLPLPEGPHDLEIVSETLAFKTTVHVEIEAGKMTTIPVDLPKGAISLNATPWAEVWIDGTKVGDTPIGNLPITIGPHEIVFKNPDLGEQHHAATVTVGEPVRLSVDLTQPQ
jgi:hypothetical protein